ncbi:MAG: Eco57I restriction-modification methylase domain-containing protein, partial [Thermodesulfobium sp.]
MESDRAQKLVEVTFRNDFDRDRFVTFIRELINDFRLDAKKQIIWREYEDYIDSYETLGTYTDPDGNTIGVITVKLKRYTSIDRARTMQRNFISKYLGTGLDAALVAFYGDDPTDWRFSFVKLGYHLEKDAKGNVRPATNLTPPKRYSFLVGKTEPSHTAQSRFLELLAKDNPRPTVSEIESVFSVEKVTEEFFQEYKKLFLELEEALNKIIEQNSNLAKEFNQKGISTVDFAKKLLGQIVFIYFLQKKGWLGIEKDETGTFKAWGAGHKDFLKRLYKKEIVNYNNFFNDIIEPLFYEALAKDRTIENDYYSKFQCKIPFLNGGLFEPIGGYDWTNTDILLDNGIFGRIIETFDLYNFTVKEDEPLEKEVAIDPEMLGKIFENMLEIKDRKSKGSYYTPREIVYYMCQESLINYLETRTGIYKKNIEDFIHNGEVSIQIRNDKEKVDLLLKNIKVVDPAIGSGAFLVGMMMEIVKARNILTQFFPKEEQSERTSYNFKRECIEDSLYGVDIDPGAIDIAQLRLWLSLIVDETDIHKIKPLPNLDYKIMCGNSLLDEFEGVKLFDERLLGETHKIDYLEITNIEEMIKKLYKELGEIQTGKKKDNGRIRVIKKEINKLKKKKQELITSPKREGVYRSLFETKKIKESQKKLKEIRALHKQFFNEHNRRNKIELRAEIEKMDWEFIGETLKEQGNEEAMKKLEQIKKTRSKPFFLWKLYFSDVFQENSGFDVVIGNPPYIKVQELTYAEIDFFKEKYKFAHKRLDISLIFFEMGLSLLNGKGILTFISSNQFLVTEYGEMARQLLRPLIKKIINFDSLPLFQNALTYTSIFLVEKRISESLEYAKITSIEEFKVGELNFNTILKKNLGITYWTLDNNEALNLLNKLKRCAHRLGDRDIAESHYGII